MDRTEMSDTTRTLIFILLAVVIFGAGSYAGYRKLRWLREQDRASGAERGEVLAGPGEVRLAWVQIVVPLVVLVVTVVAILAS
jgi:hypothetical protein